jgi:alpha-mannosidase
MALTASMQQGAHGVHGQRIEAPQFVEIADESYRTTILTPGLPFYRKSGERMLDMLLLAEGETARSFRFAVAVDAKYPLQAQRDQYSPPLIMTTIKQPADGGQQGWFFNVSAANVQLTRILPGTTDKSVVVRLLETEGRSRVFGLACYRTPVSARQIDFQGEQIAQLRIDDAVNVEISPYEICDVELFFA